MASIRATTRCPLSIQEIIVDQIRRGPSTPREIAKQNPGVPLGTIRSAYTPLERVGLMRRKNGLHIPSPRWRNASRDKASMMEQAARWLYWPQVRKSRKRTRTQ